MVSWRERLNPDEVAGLVHSSGRRNVSQFEMAALCEVSEAWYGALERGDLDRRYSADFLDRVAANLKLSTGERRVLFLLATGREPSARPPSAPKISSAVVARLNREPWPAYLVDTTWQILARNDATQRWLPGLIGEAGGNLMRWVFCSPSAKKQMVDWEYDAHLAMAQLRARFAVAPEHDRLQQLIHEILATSEFAASLWKDDPCIWLHDDGNRQRLLLPGSTKALGVEILSSTPLRNPDLRAYSLVPVAGAIPADCTDAAPANEGDADLAWRATCHPGARPRPRKITIRRAAA
ncbi:MAG: helix-turn-helix transcriptional regulator [Catenulispora sp.]|nr:helix-turn-helix transcriptional regulator [Catenulispora sp.]NUT40032.1 helix-turn-helix transcriptional regulator [Thermoactinospora sp.]